MDELAPSVVDIFLSAVSQTQGSRSGPIGRIESLKNGVVTHYDPGRGLPRRIKVKQRNGFGTLPTTGHRFDTGASSNPSWGNPEFLSSIGSQLLSIANAIPRVYDGSDWTNYNEERVISNVLSESVFHTSQRTIVAQEHATSNGVTCSVWAERIDPDNTRVVLYIGFKSSDGAWVRTPQVLYDPSIEGNPDLLTYAQVISDTGGSFFWVCFNSLVSSADKYTIKLFDLNGRERDSITIAKTWVPAPGYRDIAQIHGGGMFHAQPLHTVLSPGDGVRFTAFTQTAGVIGAISTDNAAIHCRGPLAFVTNDFDNGWYLATIGLGDNPVGRLWGYQLLPPTPNPLAHEYNFAIQPQAGTTVDSMIGFVKPNLDVDNPTGIPDMYVSITSLQGTAQTAGPLWDPQLRYSKCYSCDFVNNVVFQRQNDYTCQVSRAFKHDDEYFSVNYYQSGSGNLISQTQVAVNFTPGDYIIGAKEQPVTVSPADKTIGSAVRISGAGAGVNNIDTSHAVPTFDIQAGDTVEIVTVTINAFNAQGPQTCLKWTFAGLALTNGGVVGGRLVISGTTGVTGANATWDVLGAGLSGGNFIYTTFTNTLGSGLVPGTFAHNGNATVSSMTVYRLPTLGQYYDNQTRAFLLGGSAVITGNSGGNNGTKTIVRVIVGWTAEFDPYGLGPGIWVTTGSEFLSDDNFDAVLTPTTENQWTFSRTVFDDSLLIGPHTLIVEHSEFIIRSQQFHASVLNIETAATNDSSGEGYAITDVPSAHVVKTDGAAITAEILQSPLPTVTIRVPDDVNSTDNRIFFLQDVEPDASYKGALLVVTNDTVAPGNNGVYQIVGFDPDPSKHLIYAVPADGNTVQRSQMFIPDDQSITIVFGTNVQPEFQPCWLMVPLTGTKPVVGRFDYQLAYADWRFEGDAPPNMFPLSVMTPVTDADGWLFMLPYRAISFTVGQSIATSNGQIVNAAVASSQSTVGLKQFRLSNSVGNATVSSTSLMLPGPMSGEFNSSGFSENGVNFGFEAPFIVSQQVSGAGSGAALRIGGTYQVVAVGEFTTEAGDRVFSIVSPPLNYTLSGSNNSVTYGVRLMQPLDANGAAVPKHFGVTNRRLVGISLYRTSYENDAPTTDHHKITLDLNVNGLAPVSDTNASGFSFPDEFTAHYKDENIDAAILNNELLYTDKGFLPRFPAPANRNGDFWKERTWVVGYDGAVWMSAEKKEGDASWYFPLWRVVLPTTDKPIAVAGMDDYLIIGCEKSMWLLPSANFPNATGREGGIPRPVQLPFTNGCTGFMKTLRQGVAYSSTDGGVWLVTRQLTNEFFSQTAQDTLGQIPITGMTIDKHQRLIVANGTSRLAVYDQIVGMWYNDWSLPTSNAKFLSTLDGEPVFQDNSHVWLHDPQSFADDLAGTPVGVPIDVTFSSFQFANVRGLKSVWEMQIVGDYKGVHHLNAVISYPDDDPANPTVFPDPADGPYTPDPSLPYLMAINPMIEQASSYGLRVFADFDGIVNPGNSFELEVISCEVGIDSATGLDKTPDSQRIVGK